MTLGHVIYCFQILALSQIDKCNLIDYQSICQFLSLVKCCMLCEMSTVPKVISI